MAAQSFEAPGVHVIENGIDLDRCRALVPREVTRAAWGLRSDEIAVGYVGRLSPEKNCIAVGDAVAAMGAPYRAVFVGPSYDPAYAQQVRTAARGGIFVPPMEHVGDALAALDVIVLVSPAEGGPLVVLEALAAGIPVVATPVGNLPDLVQRHGDLLVSVPIDPSADQLAAAVHRAIAPDWRDKLPGISTVVEQHFSARRMAKDWTAYLEATCRSVAHRSSR